MEAACRGKMNVHFLHIRKTGGTAIKSALEHAQSTPNAVIYTHPHRVCLADIPRRHKVMFALRDPVDRYVSGFMSRYHQGAPAHSVPWSQEEAKVFARFHTPESLAFALDSAHPAYDEAIHAMKVVSHLNCLQWNWLGDERLFEERSTDFLWVGQLRTLQADFEELREFLQLPAGITLPHEERAANRSSNISHTERVMSSQAEKNVQDWYAEDYRLIELCESWRDKNCGTINRLLFTKLSL